MKTLLFFYLLVVLAVTFVWPSWRVWRKIGVNPVTFGQTDNAHDFIGRWFKILLVLLGVATAIFSFGGSFYQWLTPVTWLETDFLVGVGCIVLGTTLLWVVLAQWQMGQSWRIGIDEANKTPLVTNGIFAWSRNPIFLGMLGMLLGLLLVMPNAFSLTFLVAGYLLLQVQVRLEEDFLTAQHGEGYRAYQQRVRRWL
jgi:protein-S-isoprenylcysteine O-methyltransferase Ste14